MYVGPAGSFLPSLFGVFGRPSYDMEARELVKDVQVPVTHSERRRKQLNHRAALAAAEVSLQLQRHYHYSTSASPSVSIDQAKSRLPLFPTNAASTRWQRIPALRGPRQVGTSGRPDVPIDRAAVLAGGPSRAGASVWRARLHASGVGGVPDGCWGVSASCTLTAGSDFTSCVFGSLYSCREIKCLYSRVFSSSWSGDGQ